MSWVYCGVGFLFGFFVRDKFRSIWNRGKVAVHMIRSGICFRYSLGPWENRGGTSSNFCTRCGHPHGYHWLDYRGQWRN